MGAAVGADADVVAVAVVSIVSIVAIVAVAVTAAVAVVAAVLPVASMDKRWASVCSAALDMKLVPDKCTVASMRADS